MLTRLLSRVDRGVDSKLLGDASGVLSQVGGAAHGIGDDAVRPRSAFAELMSTGEGGGEVADGVDAVVVDKAAIDALPPSDGGGAPEPFTPSFDLPAFLQVLPRSGGEVAVAAAREPGLAAAVRRLPMPKDASEARSVDVPDVAIRLPSFLVPQKGDAPVMPGVATASVPSVEPSPVDVPTGPLPQGPGRPVAPTIAAVVTAEPAAPIADASPTVAPTAAAASQTSTPARTATAALESALRRAVPGSAAKDAATAPGATAAPQPAPVVDPVAQGALPPTMLASTQPPIGHISRHKPSMPSGDGRKASVTRTDAAERGLRERAQPDLSALFNPLQRSIESLSSRTEAMDRGSRVGRPAGAAADVGTTAPSIGAAADLSAVPTPAAIEQGERAGPTALMLRHPVGTEAWQDELSAQLSFMADRGEGSEAVMKLAPEELGELEVRVEVRDGEASLQFGVLNADARQAVEGAQSRLRELFSGQGMNVSEFSVFSSLNGNSQSPSNDGRGPRTVPRTGADGEGELEVVVRSQRSVGVVDLYA